MFRRKQCSNKLLIDLTFNQNVTRPSYDQRPMINNTFLSLFIKLLPLNKNMFLLNCFPSPTFFHSFQLNCVNISPFSATFLFFSFLYSLHPSLSLSTFCIGMLPPLLFHSLTGTLSFSITII